MPRGFRQNTMLFFCTKAIILLQLDNADHNFLGLLVHACAVLLLCVHRVFFDGRTKLLGFKVFYECVIVIDVECFVCHEEFFVLEKNVTYVRGILVSHRFLHLAELKNIVAGFFHYIIFYFIYLNLFLLGKQYYCI